MAHLDKMDALERKAIEDQKVYQAFQAEPEILVKEDRQEYR